MRASLAVVALASLALALGLMTGERTAEAAAPPLQLPWPTGDQHRISGGNTYGCDTHKTSNASGYAADYYAIDFQFGPVDGSPLDVSATATGTVVYRANNNDGYGNKVVLDHGGGYFTVYAHLANFAVGEQEPVEQGDLLGNAGGSGGVPVHLHFHMQNGNAAHKPEPMSGVTGFGQYGYCTGVASPYWTSGPPCPGGGPWSGWENLGGVLSSAPGAASWGCHRLDVLARGGNNALFHKWWNGSQWSGWNALGGTLTSAPAVASWGPNRLDVFMRGPNNALLHTWWNGSQWFEEPWENLGGCLSSAPAVASWGPNRLDVLVRGCGPDYALWHKWWDGSAWSRWVNIGVGLISAPAVASWGPNRLDVFIRGGNNVLYHKWCDGAQCDGAQWAPGGGWENLGGYLTSAPAVASWGSNRLDVFIRGGNNALFHKWWDGSGWSGWVERGGTLTSAPAVASWGPNRLDVFIRGGNNVLYHKWW
jgi:hypothetical protein